MKIVLDECLPKKLVKIFHEHEVFTVPQLGLAGEKDGKLLNELDERGIHIFITIDGNIEYQQKFSNRNFGTVVIRSTSNRLDDLLHLENELLNAVKNVSMGELIRVPDKS